RPRRRRLDQPRGSRASGGPAQEVSLSNHPGRRTREARRPRWRGRGACPLRLPPRLPFTASNVSSLPVSAFPRPTTSLQSTPLLIPLETVGGMPMQTAPLGTVDSPVRAAPVPGGYRTTPDQDNPGWPPGVPYIVGNEVCERYSFYGMRAILKIHLVAL